MQKILRNFLIELQELGIERVYKYCYQDKQADWESKISELIKNDENISTDIEDKLNEYYVTCKIVLMINKMKEEKEPWDEIWINVKDFVKALKLSDTAKFNVFIIMNKYFPGALSFALNVYGDENDKTLIREIESAEQQAVLEYNRQIDPNSIDFPSEWIRTSCPKRQLKELSVQQRKETNKRFKKFIGGKEKEAQNNITLLNEKFDEREEAYEQLAQAELKYGKSGDEYIKAFEQLRLIRGQMNIYLEEVKLNPVFSFYTFISKELCGSKSENFVGKIIRLYHTIPKTVISKRNGKKMADLGEGVQRQGTAILEEMYAREVVTSIDYYIEQRNPKPSIRKFLIGKKVDLLKDHPEVENWYFQYSFFDSENLLGKYDLSTIPLLNAHPGELDICRKHFVMRKVKETIDCFAHHTLISSKDEQLYESICISSLRKLLNAQENDILDEHINDKLSLYEDNRSKCSPHIRKLLFLRWR